jgi:hypothetical protein
MDSTNINKKAQRSGNKKSPALTFPPTTRMATRTRHASMDTNLTQVQCASTQPVMGVGGAATLHSGGVVTNAGPKTPTFDELDVEDPTSSKKKKS